jgi:hypothetical protein
MLLLGGAALLREITQNRNPKISNSAGLQFFEAAALLPRESCGFAGT